MTLAESWDGTGWQPQSTPNATGAAADELLGVSCPTTSSCTAVGYSSDGSEVSLAESWDGTSWSLEPEPSTASNSILLAVSCPTTAACTAVGFDNYVPIASVWSDSSWTTATAAIPIGAAVSRLLGVSCLSASQCVAVGDWFDKAGNEAPLAETWSGTAWATEGIFSPSGVTQSDLAGISCTPATSACTAAGSGYEAGTVKTLVEQQATQAVTG